MTPRSVLMHAAELAAGIRMVVWVWIDTEGEYWFSHGEDGKPPDKQGLQKTDVMYPSGVRLNP